jgi:hypothetical protein
MANYSWKTAVLEILKNGKLLPEDCSIKEI